MPADWTVTATPVAIPGQGPVSGNGDPTSPGGVNAVTVLAGSYDLSESGPTGFTPGTWVCQGGVVSRLAGHGARARDRRLPITNQAVAPTLTLVKVVDNGTTGATAVPTDWTLSAAGPTPISGATGSAAVTNAPVHVGTYTLGESGPPGYTAGAWTCQGGTAVDGAITLVEGQAATCTIINTATAGVWELTKLANPPSGTTVDPGLDDHLHADRRPRERGAGRPAPRRPTTSRRCCRSPPSMTPLPAGLTMVGSTITWADPDDPRRRLGRRSASASPSRPTPAGRRCSTWPRRRHRTGTARRARRSTPSAPPAVVPPVNPTVPPEPPSIPTSGTDVVGPLRWAAIFLTSGTLLLVTTLRRRTRLRRPRPA